MWQQGEQVSLIKVIFEQSKGSDCVLKRRTESQLKLHVYTQESARECVCVCVCKHQPSQWKGCSFLPPSLNPVKVPDSPNSPVESHHLCGGREGEETEADPETCHSHSDSDRKGG